MITSLYSDVGRGISVNGLQTSNSPGCKTGKKTTDQHRSPCSLWIVLETSLNYN